MKWMHGGFECVTGMIYVLWLGHKKFCMSSLVLLLIIFTTTQATSFQEVVCVVYHFKCYAVFFRGINKSSLGLMA